MPPELDQPTIRQYVAETFEHVSVVIPAEGLPAGDTFFLYDPTGDLEPTEQQPFATIVTKDYGDFDSASQLDRPGVYRLNIGLSPETFRRLFGPPATAAQAQHLNDFAALDRLLPHPFYAPQGWVCVLNPSPATFETLKPLLAEAYSRAAQRLSRRRQTRDAGRRTGDA